MKIQLSSDEKLAYVSYRSDGFVIYDTSDLSSIQFLSQYKWPNATTYNQNSFIMSKINPKIAFLGFSAAGLAIVDTTNPSSVSQISLTNL
jgi:hypothetical protein